MSGNILGSIPFLVFNGEAGWRLWPLGDDAHPSAGVEVDEMN